MTTTAQPIRILFVCMGNICRSPTAQGVFGKLLEETGLSDAVIIDSAGTHAYHTGSLPDPRACDAASSRSIDLTGQRARRVESEDFASFDYVIAMDKENLESLRERCPPAYKERLHLMMSFAPQATVSEVPDPYYGGRSGFDRVFEMLESASRGLLVYLRQQHNL